MELITAKGLVPGYDGMAVSGKIDFSLKEGDYLCVTGENGSGKTTLMKTVLGLTKPVSGELVFSSGFSRSDIGYLPQQTDIQRDFPSSVYEIVMTGNLPHSKKKLFYDKSDRENADTNMKRMGIYALRRKSYRELSGGQQQRTLLARALCSASKMLLLDEPVSGLDPQATADMYKLIKELNDGGMTVMMISHDTVSALKYASHILHMGGGVFFGTKDEFIKSDGALSLKNDACSQREE